MPTSNPLKLLPIDSLIPKGLSRSLRLGLCLSLSLGLAACNPKSIVGGVEVKDRKGQTNTTPPGGMVYVCDFKLDSSQIQMDPTGNGLAGGLMNSGNSGGGLLGSGGILGRLKQRGQPEVHGTAEEQAKQIVDKLAEDITQSLNKSHVPATRLSKCEEPPANQGWLVRGEFLVVDEGNRAERAAIGFGEGATRMDVSVTVADLSKNSSAPLASFGTSKDPNRRPGAIVTMNPYALAAKFHMEKNATGKDVSQTAEEIATEISKLATPDTKPK